MIVKNLTFFRSDFLLADPNNASSPMITPRAQINANTAWLDMSWLYSADQATLDKQLNSTDQCKLRLDIFYPAPEKVSYNTDHILLGGSPDINLTPVLHAFFNLFGQYHNQICDQYRELNPSWTPFIRFHESRAWVIGVYQHLVFRMVLFYPLYCFIASNFLWLPYSMCQRSSADPSVLTLVQWKLCPK